MWVARDKEGELNLFYELPYRGYFQDDEPEIWDCNGSHTIFELPEDMFPKLKWEDEPLEVELVVKGKVNELIDYICEQNREIKKIEQKWQQ